MSQHFLPGLFALLGTFLGESLGTVKLRDIVVPTLKNVEKIV
jgi:hypothetical protein